MIRRNRYTLIQLTIWITSMLISVPALSQFYARIFQNDADTLYTQVKEAPAAKLPHLYNQLAFHYSFDQADSCLYYAEKALALAAKRNDRVEEASAYRHMGNAWAMKGNYRSSIYYLQKALEILKVKNDRRAYLETLADLSRTNYDAELYDRTIALNKEVYQMIEESKNDEPPLVTPLEQALLTGLMAISYREARDYETGIRLFREYLRLAGEADIPPTAHRHFVKSAAEIFTYAGQYDSALKYTLLARNFLQVNIGKSPDQYTGYEGSLGSLYNLLDQPFLAISYLKKQLAEFQTDGSYRYAAITAYELGDVYMKAGQYDSVIYYYQTALQEAEKLHSSVTAISQTGETPNVFVGYQYFYNISELEVNEIYYKLMVSIHKRLYSYYKKTGNLSLSLKHHEDLMLYIDSLNTSRKNTEFRRMQLQFATDQIEQENALLQRDNELKDSRIRQNRLVIGAIITIAFLILVAGVALFRQSRLKSLQEKILLEQRLLRTQMNPHFIFNSLASIQNFIFKKDDINARIYLSRFSELVRSILEFSTRETITFAQEIHTIRNYLELQKVRFQDKFDYTIDMDENIDEEVMELPPMLAQPFIENAIEHGIRHKEIKGHIHIRCKRNNDVTMFEVEDDGVGRKRSKEIEARKMEDHLSMATSITHERLSALNKKSKKKIILEIIDLKDEQGEARGTLVRFEIPFIP